MKQETIRKRRKEIIRCALSVFGRRGIEHATLDEVALRARLSKPGLYLYFKNKEDLLFSIVDDKISELENEAAALAGPARLRLARFIALMIRFYRKNAGVFLLFQQSDPKIWRRHHKKIQTRILRNIAHLTAFMKECVAEGLLRPGDTASYSHSLIGLINANIFRYQIKSPSVRQIGIPETLAPEILHLFLDGAGRKGGRR